MSKVSEVKSNKSYVTLLDGKQRELKFTLNAMAELEMLFGSVEVCFNKLEKENSLVALRAVLWAGFLHQEPEITLQQVGNLIDAAFLHEMINTVNKALDSDMPQENVLPEVSGPN